MGPCVRGVARAGLGLLVLALCMDSAFGQGASWEGRPWRADPDEKALFLSLGLPVYPGTEALDVFTYTFKGERKINGFVALTQDGPARVSAWVKTRVRDPREGGQAVFPVNLLGPLVVHGLATVEKGEVEVLVLDVRKRAAALEKAGNNDPGSLRMLDMKTGVAYILKGFAVPAPGGPSGAVKGEEGDGGQK